MAVDETDARKTLLIFHLMKHTCGSGAPGRRVMKCRQGVAVDIDQIARAPGATTPSSPARFTSSALTVVAERMISQGAIASLRSTNSRDKRCIGPRRLVP
jgi:hypothetical protein